MKRHHRPGGAPTSSVVVFDLGGVVIRWSHHATFQRMAFALNLPPEKFVRTMDAEIVPLVRGRGTMPEFWDRVGQRLGRAIPRSVRASWTQDYRKIASPDPEVAEWIRDLRRRGTQVACLSNTIRAHTRILKERGWLRPFAPALLSSELGVAKPDVRAYEVARTRIGVPPSQLLFLDDTVENVVGARRAGWKAHQFVGASDARDWIGRQFDDS
jgi:putative hydrolase of the HAD superfamily